MFHEPTYASNVNHLNALNVFFRWHSIILLLVYDSSDINSTMPYIPPLFLTDIVASQLKWAVIRAVYKNGSKLKPEVQHSVLLAYDGFYGFQPFS